MSADDDPFAWMRAEVDRACSLDDLMKRLDRDADHAAQLEMGSFYTSRPLAAEVTKHTLTMLCRTLAADPDRLEHVRIIDPFVGAGVFLVEAFKQLSNALPQPVSIERRRAIATRCLYGCDIDPRALATTEALLCYCVGDSTLTLRGTTLYRRDMFAQLPDVQATSQRFHAVLTNPPWVAANKQNIGINTTACPELKGGHVNQYALGVVVALRLLTRSSGGLGILLPASFCTDHARHALRMHLLDRLNAYCVVACFSGLQATHVFPNVKQAFVSVIGMTKADDDEPSEQQRSIRIVTGDCAPVQVSRARIEAFRMIPFEYGNVAVRSVFEVPEAQSVAFDALGTLLTGIQGYDSSKRTLLDLSATPDERHCARYWVGRELYPFRPPEHLPQPHAHACPRHHRRQGPLWIDPRPSTDVPVEQPKCNTTQHHIDASKAHYRALGKDLAQERPLILWRRVLGRPCDLYGREIRFTARWLVAQRVTDGTAPVYGSNSVQGLRWMPPIDDNGWPTTEYFVLGLLNSLLFSLAMETLSTSGSVSLTILRQARVPRPTSSDNRDRSTTLASWMQLIADDCGLTSVPDEALFAYEFCGDMHDAHLIGQVAQHLEQQPYPTKGVLLWYCDDAPPLRARYEHLLNVLVARWYGLSHDAYRQVLAMIKRTAVPSSSQNAQPKAKRQR